MRKPPRPDRPAKPSGPRRPAGSVQRPEEGRWGRPRRRPEGPGESAGPPNERRGPRRPSSPPRSQRREPRFPSPEPRFPSPAPRASSPEPRTPSPAPRPEPRTTSPSPRFSSPERSVPGPRSPVPVRDAAAAWVVGFHAVLAALEHQRDRVEVVCIAEGTVGGRAGRVLDAARSAGVRCHPLARRQLDEIAAGTAHNGFAARLAPVALAAAGALLELPGPVCLIGLDTLEDPHNLGAVARLAAGLGLGGIVVSGPHPPPLGGAVAKVAAGTLPLVRIAHVGSLGDFARQAKDAGFWVVGADMEGTPVTGFELPERLLLCLGAEAGGLRAKTRAALDATVAIPLAAGVESLNLSVATAILAWEWRRRHSEPGNRQ